MIDPLYQKEILRLAALAHGSGRLPAPDATADLRNPLCGDRITLDIAINQNRISAVGHNTRACVLCQASASLLAETLTGLAPDDCTAARQAVEDFLGGAATDVLPAPFARFSIFAPVVPHPARHTCVLLPFEALEKALSGLAVSVR